jgi:cytochrome P450
LVSQALQGPNLEQRGDILALLLQACYEDGTPISRSDIADELLTMLVAGDETTATSLSWTLERIRRHPRLLARLTAEVDTGGRSLSRQPFGKFNARGRLSTVPSALRSNGFGSANG